MCDHLSVPSLICHLYGNPVDLDGPAVSESHNWDHEGDWVSRWVPWVSDIHGGIPDRLVHPLCFANDGGLEALLELIAESEARRQL